MQESLIHTKFGSLSIRFTPAREMTSIEFVQNCVQDIWKIQEPHIIRNPEGRLFVQPGNVKFSVSHTQHILGCLISRPDFIWSSPELELGFDLADLSEEIDFELVLKTYFPESERNWILNQCESEQKKLFKRLWTYKESIIKASQTPMEEVLRCAEFECIEVNQKKIWKLQERNGFKIIEWEFYEGEIGPSLWTAAIFTPSQ